MPQKSPKVLAKLEKLHVQYCTYNQNLCDQDSVIVKRNGPYALEFSVLRAAFDKLRFACNSGARRISYRDEFEHSEYWSPSIRLPKTAPSDYNKRMAWLHEQADKDWPDPDQYRIDPGTLYVTTSSMKLIGALVACLDSPLEHPNRGDIVTENAARFSFHPRSPQAMSDMLQVIRRHHRKWLLPERTDADTIANLAPLELSDKLVISGMVDRVVVDDHRVVIPMIPINDKSEHLIRETTTTLVDLVDQGLPYSRVRGWFSQFLLPSSIKVLDRKYSYKEAPSGAGSGV